MPDIKKNSMETLRVQLTEYKNHKLVDIRVFFETAEGELKPTRKGVTLNTELIDWLIDALKNIKKELPEKQKGG